MNIDHIIHVVNNEYLNKERNFVLIVLVEWFFMYGLTSLASSYLLVVLFLTSRIKVLGMMAGKMQKENINIIISF